MSDAAEAERLAIQREKVEGDLVANRIRELRTTPVGGGFDLAHLKAIHAHIFQDLPHHRPGVVRADTVKSWIKHRTLEEDSGVYSIGYVHNGVAARLTRILKLFGGSRSVKGLSIAAAADRLAQLYGDLDHAHGFYEGNSRTLREFFRELASEAGFLLDWIGTGVGTDERNALYVARDLAVLERAFPDLTPERAMSTNDRTEYEAHYRMERPRRSVGVRTLAMIIGAGLSQDAGD